MVSQRAVTVLCLMLIASVVSAQQSAEFLRGTGGELVMTPKGSAPFSGSLELSMSTANDVFGRGSSPAYGATAGGTLVQDRLWFFASVSRQELAASRFEELALPENATASALGARVNGQIAGAHDFSAFFEAARRPEFSTTPPSSFAGTVPSSFLSMRYSAAVSSNMLFNASFTRSSRTMRGVGLMPAE